MGKLQDWVDEEWVRIDSSGNIAGLAVRQKTKRIRIVAYLKLKQKV
jgi:hypothetical protein